MPLRLKRGLSAAFALAALAGLMIHAGATSGCASSSPAAAPEPPSNAAAPEAPGKAAPPAQPEETYFPASKAGTMRPHKSVAPPAQQQAQPQNPPPQK